MYNDYNEIQLNKFLDKYAKKIESLERKEKESRKREKEMRKKIKELEKELKKNKEEQSKKNELFQQNIDWFMESFGRCFKFIKALAYSTNRFVNNSEYISSETDIENMKQYIKEYNLKEPEIAYYIPKNIPQRYRNIHQIYLRLKNEPRKELTTVDIMKQLNIKNNTAKRYMKKLVEIYCENTIGIFPQKTRNKNNSEKMYRIRWIENCTL